MKNIAIAAFGYALAATIHIPSVLSQETDPVCDNNNPASLASVGGYCTLTPEKYVVRIYEMGICSGNPLNVGGDGSFSKASCTTTLLNSSPRAVDLAPPNSVFLKSDVIFKRPDPGEYTAAYVILDVAFGLRFSYTLNNTVYMSNGTDSSVANPVQNVKTTGIAEDFIELVNNFGSPEEGFEALSSEINVSGGKIRAFLTNNNLQSAASTAQVQRLIGVFVPNSPISISKNTKGLDVKFIVKDQGGGLEVCDRDDSKVCQFGSGPFSAMFVPF